MKRFLRSAIQEPISRTIIVTNTTAMHAKYRESLLRRDERIKKNKRENRKRKVKGIDEIERKRGREGEGGSR